MKKNITRRKFLGTAGIVAAGLTVPQIAHSAIAGRKRKPPNIILIMSDDVSPDLYGCYGNDSVKTPNIDFMAREGVQFQTAWSCAICSPTRAMIMTGRYANRTGFYHNNLYISQNGETKDLHKYHHSFAKLMKQTGYATAIAGKWHLGKGTPYSEEGGFDEYCLWESIGKIRKLSGNQEYKNGWENDNTTARYWHPGIVQNHKLLDTKPDDFGPDIFTDFICDFVKRKKDQPFLAYYPMVAPHGTRVGPSTTPKRGSIGEIQKSVDSEENAARFQGMNEYIDVLVGRIIQQVQDLGLLENTIIIYCSDNGSGSTAKSRAVERGCRVPFVAYGGPVKKRGLTAELTDLTDILPTLLDYAGGKLPSDYRVDGTSLKPFLSGETDRHRDWIYSTIGTSQLVRTKRYLLEAVNPILDMPRGRFYDCGDSRDGYGYINVTNSEDQQVQKARTEFDQILKKYPPLTKNHPFFQTKRGRKVLGGFTSVKYARKHLHNHKDFRRYEE